MMTLGLAGPRVGAVEVVAQKPQKERERLRSRGSACEGARHLLLLMPVISGTVALVLPSAKDLEDLARLASPRERFLCLLRPSLELCPPFPRFPLPLRRVVPLHFASPVPRRDPLS